MTTTSTQLEAQIRSLSDVAVSEDLASFEVDGLRPSLVVAPGTQDEVASLLRAASEADAAVIPWGAGSHMSLGMPPVRYDLTLDLRRLNRVIEYVPADMTVTVEAGIALSELQQRLGTNGQWLALDPPGDAAMTIGGLLAANVSGPARYSRGSLRDLLIGISFVTADGLSVKAGGRVVKNVAGYDLGKLQIGALGTLGVITQATFKIGPRPAQVADGQALGSLEPLLRFRDALEGLRLPIQSLVMRAVPGPGALWMLNVRFAGGAAAVTRSRQELERAAAAELLQILRDDNNTWEDRGAGVYRSDLPLLVHASFIPSALASLCPAFARTAGTVVCYPSVGVLDAGWETPPSFNLLTELRKACVDAGGAMVLQRAPMALKRRLGVWGEPRGDFALMRAIKDELDPKHLLNPGRFVGDI